MIKTEIITISPTQAKKMLKLNTRNRPVNNSKVDFYAGQIESGDWELNGESIKLSKDMLLDGQHRLKAIIQAGKSIKTVVMTGLGNEVFNTIDTGKNRSGGDVLGISGHKNSKRMATMLKTLNRYYNIKWGDRAAIPNKEYERLADQFSDVGEYAKDSHPNTSGLIPWTAVACCEYIFDRISIEDRHKFMEGLCDGTGLKKRSVIYALRNKLIKKQLAGEGMRTDEAMANIIKAWNFWRAGKETTRLIVDRLDNPEVAK
jgi:hypothetical protein